MCVEIIPGGGSMSVDKYNELLKLGIDELLRLAEIGERMQWVPTKDRLPKIVRVSGDFDIDHSEEVIIFANGEVVTGTTLFKDEAGYCFMDGTGLQFTLDDVTHWMPLPELPKGDTP